MKYGSNEAPNRSAKFKRGERGSTIVEFGLVLVPTLGMMFLAMNVAWIFFGWACLQEGVREGVRYGITGPVSSGLDSAIKNFMLTTSVGFINNTDEIQIEYLSPSTLTNVTGQAGATQAGNVLKVTASITMKSLVPVWTSNGKWMGAFTTWTVPLTAASADVLETGSPAPSE